MGGGGGGEGGGVPDPRGPRHHHADLTGPPVQLQHLRSALEAQPPVRPRHLLHVVLRDGEVERDRHELSHGLPATGLVGRYVWVDVPGDGVLGGGVAGVRRVAVDVPGEESGWVGLGEEAVRQQPVAQEVPGAQAEYLGS